MIYVNFSGRYHAFGPFNSNGYPEEKSKALSKVCENRLSMFFFQLDVFERALIDDRNELVYHVRKNYRDLFKGVESKEFPFLCKNHFYRYKMAFHSLLYSLKSFLDVYSRLICKCIHPERSPTTFGSKNIDGEKVSGGKLVIWLQNNPGGEGAADSIVELIKKHSNAWITQATSYRDTLAHYGEVQELKNMRYQINPSDKGFDKKKIEEPTINNELLSKYVFNIAVQLVDLVNDSTAQIPNIKKDLVNPMNVTITNGHWDWMTS